MKRLIYSLIALAALVTVSLVWEGGFQADLDRLEDMSQQALDLLAAEDYAQSGEIVRQISDRFEVLEERWTIVINLNLLDDISNQTTEVRALLEQKEYEHAAAQLAVVKTLFRDLSDQYKFSLGNIF